MRAGTRTMPRTVSAPGKVNTLGGFTGAVLLAAFALLMASESVQRLVVPVPIAFDQAISSPSWGSIVNGVSMLILGHHHDADHADHHDHGHHDEDHDHDHDHHHDHEPHAGTTTIWCPPICMCSPMR